MTGADLFDELEVFLATYVAFPSEEARVAAVCWAVHAHAIEAFDSTPRLAILSPEPGSGKSRLLEVLELVTPTPMHVLSASAPAIFRSIEKNRPTLLFDEVDTLWSRSGRDNENEDLRGLLNAGHRAGATIPRCVGPTHDVVNFPVFCAVALAGLGDLPDTLMTRSVVIRMRRRLDTEKVRPFRYRVDAPIGEELGDRIAIWANDHHDALADSWPEMPDGIEDRPADVWEPLIAVADQAGGLWPSRARRACVALAGAAMSREASLGIRLLTDLRDIFNGNDKMATDDILTRLQAIEESPWSDLKGKPLDARGLSWRLGNYEVASTKVRIGERSVRGYRAEDLYDAWRRYTPQTAEQAEHAEHLTRVPSVPDVPFPAYTDGDLIEGVG